VILVLLSPRILQKIRPFDPMSGLNTTFFGISVVLTLNFAHFREDSSRAKAALPRRHADTPIRRYNRHMWLRLRRAVTSCSKSLSSRPLVSSRSPLNKPIPKPVKVDANMNRSFFFIISGLLSILSGAQAQPAATPTPDQPSRIISVYGTATVHVAPNLATITIAVVTQNKDALQAQQENAKRSTAVINAVKGVSDSAMEVSTGEYTIVVQHPVEGNVRMTQIAGYQVTNSISVKMRDLSKVGEVLDQSTLAGANSVSNVIFGLENNEASRRDVLSAATADAVARVQAIVRGLNANDASPVRFRTIDISEAGLEYTPWRATDQQMRTFALPAAGTPVEAGKMDVTATVCLRAELL
jgi:uncharacterized protein